MRAQLILAVSLLALPSSSFADENAGPTPDMQSLYDEAIRLMNTGKHAQACPMIEQVTKMAPDGLGAKFTLAECYEEQGALANAYRMFVLVAKAAQENGQAERHQKAAARADALRPKLGRITFTGPQSLASGYALYVEIDSVGIESGHLEEPWYVNAGTHHIVAFTKGVQRSERTVDVAAGAVREISIRELLNLPTRESSADSSPSAESASSSSSSTWDFGPNDSTPKAKRQFPVWQTFVGGLGLVAIGVGVAFKLDSVAAEEKLIAQCGDDLLCPRNTPYHPDDDNARKNRGFGLFLGMTALGGMALTTATVGMIRWHKGTQSPKTGLMVRPTFSPAHGGIIFSGSF